MNNQPGKISLAEMREVIRFDPLPEQKNLKMRAADVLALIDAVEAAHKFVDLSPDYGFPDEGESHQTYMQTFDAASDKVNEALSRFDFDQPLARFDHSEPA